MSSTNEVNTTGKSGCPTILQTAADSIIDVDELVFGRDQVTADDDAGLTTIDRVGSLVVLVLELDHQRTACITLQPKTTVDVLVGNFDHVADDVHDVGIVQDHFRRDSATANLQPVE